MSHGNRGGNRSLTQSKGSERRPADLLKSLIMANATWGLLCLGALPFRLSGVSIFGAAHVLAEGFFVLWLARMERQFRDLLEWR